MTLNVSATVELARRWWTFIVRGLAAIAFGALAFAAPIWGIALLVAFFAAWALIDGAGSLITGIRGDVEGGLRWWELLEGVAGIAAGLIALIFPIYAAGVLLLIIAVWSIVTGVFQIVGAVRLRNQIQGELWLALAGVASILFGAVLFFFPAAGALSLVLLIGSFAIVWGVFLVMLGWRLRRIDSVAKVDAPHDHSRP